MKIHLSSFYTLMSHSHAIYVFGTNSYVFSFDLLYFFFAGVIFNNDSIIDPDSVNNSVKESLHNLRGSWFHPLYTLLYDSTQDPKLNKQVRRLNYFLLIQNMYDIWIKFSFNFAVVLQTDGCCSERTIPRITTVICIAPRGCSSCHSIRAWFRIDEMFMW